MARATRGKSAPGALDPDDPVVKADQNWREQGWEAGTYFRAALSVFKVEELIRQHNRVGFDPFKLTTTRHEALAVLFFSRGGEMSLGKLGQRLLVHPTSITATVDTLERLGYVEPRRPPDRPPPDAGQDHRRRARRDGAGVAAGGRRRVRHRRADRARGRDLVPAAREGAPRGRAQRGGAASAQQPGAGRRTSGERRAGCGRRAWPRPARGRRAVRQRQPGGQRCLGAGTPHDAIGSGPSPTVGASVGSAACALPATTTPADPRCSATTRYPTRSCAAGAC